MAIKELDRFDPNPKRDMQIATKLRLIIAGAIIISCLGVGFLSLQIFNSGLIKTVIDDLSHTADGVELNINERSVHLAGYAAILSEMQELKQAANLSSAKLQNFISNAAEFGGLSFLFITDARGRVYTGGGAGVTGGIDVSYIGTVAEALRGNASSGIEGIANFKYAIAAAHPVFFAGRVVGCIVAGYDMTDGTMVKSISNNYNVECTIFKDDVRMSTSLVSENNETLVGSKLNNSAVEQVVLRDGNGYMGKVSIAGKRFYSYYFPILSGNGKITGMIFIAKSLHSMNAVRANTLRIVMPIALLLAAVLIVSSGMFINWLMWRIKNVTNQLDEMATGEADLTKRCKLFIRDEIGFLVIKFDAFCDKLQSIISELKNSRDLLSSAGNEMTESTKETATSINDVIENIANMRERISVQIDTVYKTSDTVGIISKNFTSLSRMIESQSSGVTEASAAIEEMIGNIASVNTSVDKLSSSFDSLLNNAQMSFSSQQDVNDRIKQIENQSEMLQEANIVISSIAEQTNLLAMNAAIEAAHAGEAGKGFSVVADEIRKLSETSSQQSKTIGEQLNKILDSISDVVSASTKSGEALSAVSGKIKETEQLVIQIKAAMSEQHEGSQQIIATLKNMNDSTMEVQKSSKEISLHNERINDELRNLKDTTDAMNQNMDVMAAKAERINKTGSALSDASEQVRRSIDKIGDEINLFKT
ncbi:MAG: methyl-accepting chemotaxis protein [Bacteroides sp.]|nr:methyl-accepting chemotaxis protein [Prevotella sp.]MCM1406876.1 methyl-accepting chemotaxis protein [Treponema brennaborense]MCM1470027.1 methyl-accepting chemotaxis protein [Bacteroides sp.]